MLLSIMPLCYFRQGNGNAYPPLVEFSVVKFCGFVLQVKTLLEGSCACASLHMHYCTMEFSILENCEKYFLVFDFSIIWGTINW